MAERDKPPGKPAATRAAQPLAAAVTAAKKKPARPTNTNWPLALAAADPVAHAPWFRPAVAGFVLLGVVLRMNRYLLGFPLWGDESFLACNFIDRSFTDLLQPLEYGMVAPPLLLWLELAVVRVAGFSELSLRFLPMLASVAGMLLFGHLARRLLAGLPQLLAVAVFAVSYYPIRHGCEVKPYATDLFAALVLVALLVEWLYQPQRLRWLWGLCAATPLAVGCSYPALFVAGAVSLVLVATWCRAPSRRALLPVIAFPLALAGSAGPLLVYTAQTQYASYAATGQVSCWVNDFPPSYREPAKLATWLLERHTGHMFAYPLGGKRGGSTLTTLALLAATVVLIRRRQYALLTLAAVPLALCLAAAALERYPYGGSQRTMQFIAPLVCLLTGLGLATLLALVRWVEFNRRLVLGTLALLLILGVGLLAFDLRRPYKTVFDEQAREFARWFWTEQARDAELVCVHRDLGQTFSPQHWMYDRTAVYLCNQQLFSARHSKLQPPQLEQISADHPLRCVLYNEHPVDDPKFREWLAGMQAKYALRDCRQYQVNTGAKLKGASYEDRFLIYEFIPKPATQATAASTKPRTPKPPTRRRY